jgi:hypothetical protein
MGVILRTIDQQKLYESIQGTTGVVILNDVLTVTEADRAKAQRLTMHVHERDLMTNEATCFCENLRTTRKIGMICPECKTAVAEPFSKKLRSRVWFRAPEGTRSLMNPHILGMIAEHFKKSGFSFIEWIVNPSYTTNKEARLRDCQTLLDQGIQRGWNNFVDNFDRYMEIMFSSRLFRDKDGTDLKELLSLKRDQIFTQFIPLPNKATLIVEKSNSGVYVDKIIAGAIDVLKTITGIDTPLSSLSPRHKERRAATALLRLSEFYTDFFKDFFASKSGVFRRHVYGTRGDLTMRSVIVSITVAHEYDELHLPWAPSVVTFKLHLTNKLMKLGYMVLEIEEILRTVVKRPAAGNQKHHEWHQLIRVLLDELIAEAPGGYLPFYWNRNPILGRASCELMRATRIKDDPDDQTIGMSILAVTGFNAKFWPHWA